MNHFLVSASTMKTVGLPNGMTVQDASRHGALAVYNEVFVQECYRKHGIECNDDDVILDAGANVGLFCLWLGKLKDVKVYAFEPIKDTFDALTANLSSNVPGLKVIPVNAGLGGRSGTALFRRCSRLTQVSAARPLSEDQVETNRRFVLDCMHRWPWHAVAWALPSRFKAWLAGCIFDWYSRFELESCAMATVSDFVRQKGLVRIDLLKVDVEGGELAVLRGVEDEHWPLIRQAVVEVHQRSDLEEVETVFEHRGFEVVSESFPPPGMTLVYARRSF